MNENNMIVIGLGNPEEKYAHTRHNLGWDCLPENLSWKKEGNKLVSGIYIRPLTGMNSSGLALPKNVKPEEVIVLVDDMDLPFGTIKIKTKGSARHNGLRSIEEELGSQNYVRVKIGIGKNFEPGHQLDYVLGEFNENEKSQLPYIIERVRKVVESILTNGVDKTRENLSKI